jgi:hypothetical protein
MKLTIIIVEEGPSWLNFDVPNAGIMRLKRIPGIVDKKVPKKQYLI